MRVLVTGGAGFIGSHIVDHLIGAGAAVVVVDNLSTGREENLHPRAQFYNIDITDPALSEVFAREQPEVAIHEAAQASVDISVTSPEADAETNILGTLNLLEAARTAGTRKVVYASSAAVYGEPTYLPIDEAHPVAPLSPYGASKFTPELYLAAYRRLYGLDYVALRYANVYGPRQDALGEGGVVAVFAGRLCRGEHLEIHGDGNQTRDFVHVEDVARANLKALESGTALVCNISTGEPTSVNELVCSFAAVTGREPAVSYGPAREGDIRHSRLDNLRARRYLDWTPVRDLKEGLEETLRFYAKTLV
ncbi:MAG: NAD-dependent epimerase/dehydratase family protein [Clostridia bacterium]|nr:NAD-dependent epimerase/dehydratase family protein [Clostridia bacterium]MDQ7792165.1 NAD-dependent epimerase/dehydratase family protein [Clostridia bacterium]